MVTLYLHARGNPRRNTRNGSVYARSSHIGASLLYFGTIFCFVAGAVVGNALPLRSHMIWLSPAALREVILIMFIDAEQVQSSQ